MFLSFALPYREWLGHKEAVYLEYTALRELAGEKAPREEFLRQLRSAISVLATVLEDAEEIFKPNPLLYPSQAGRAEEEGKERRNQGKET